MSYYEKIMRSSGIKGSRDFRMTMLYNYARNSNHLYLISYEKLHTSFNLSLGFTG